MLHERCVELIMMARLASARQRRAYLDKTQNIFSQLQATLLVEDELSRGLFYLYDYSYALLQRGTWQDMAHVLAIVRTLRDTFRQLYLTMHQ
jgi:flagellin-specific chaperone FliS